jgi:hypothetical protein
VPHSGQPIQAGAVATAVMGESCCNGKESP